MGSSSGSRKLGVICGFSRTSFMEYASKNYFNCGRAFDFGADAMKVGVLPLRIRSAVFLANGPEELRFSPAQGGRIDRTYLLVDVRRQNFVAAFCSVLRPPTTTRIIKRLSTLFTVI